MFLEGGDIIPYINEGRRCLLAGYGPRSTPAAIDVLQQDLLPHYAEKIIAIHLAPWRMNLDGGFLPVADDVIVADTSGVSWGGADRAGAAEQARFVGNARRPRHNSHRHDAGRVDLFAGGGIFSA